MFLLKRIFEEQGALYEEHNPNECFGHKEKLNNFIWKILQLKFTPFFEIEVLTFQFCITFSLKYTVFSILKSYHFTSQIL